MRFAVLLLACLLGAAPAGAREPRSDTPAAPSTEIGRLDGADYRIDVPAGWNRGVVVFFHGYAIDPVVFREGERLSPMFDPILARGFAVIQSAYSGTGWALEQAAADTEKLRRRFVAARGAPKESYVMGMSMGGLLTAMTIETKPQLYDGALSLCGVLGASDRFLQRDFALRAAFDHYFPELLGPLVPVPADYRPTGAITARIDAALKSDPRAYAALRALNGGGDEHSLPGVIAFAGYLVGELQRARRRQSVRQRGPGLHRQRRRLRAQRRRRAPSRRAARRGVPVALVHAERPAEPADAGPAQRRRSAGRRLHRVRLRPARAARRPRRPFRAAVRRRRRALHVHAGAGRPRLRRARGLEARRHAAAVRAPAVNGGHAFRRMGGADAGGTLDDRIPTGRG